MLARVKATAAGALGLLGLDAEPVGLGPAVAGGGLGVVEVGLGVATGERDEGTSAESDDEAGRDELKTKVSHVPLRSHRVKVTFMIQPVGSGLTVRL